VPARHRLNLFQRMMLRWRALHPYNPVHVLRVQAALDLPRLRACIAASLQAAGLTGLALHAGHRHISWHGGPAQLEIASISPLPTPQQALHAAIEQAFNCPFEPQQPPFRFFVVADGDDGFHLGLAYDHYVAGGDAIAALLTDIALAYLGAARSAAATASRRPQTYRQLLWRHPRWLLRTLAALPAASASARRASRVPAPLMTDANNGFTSLKLPQVAALQQTAQAWGVTLNDLLLAALLQVLAPLAAARHTHTRRRQIAVAAIINIRRDFGAPDSTWPGPCLAALRVQHDVPEGMALRQLARDVHATTTAMKREHLYLHSLLGLGLSALLWPWLTLQQRTAWFPKHFPLWAGLTSLNLSPQWQAADASAVQRLDYLRAVPTGPLCPLVLAVTTAHDTLHLGLSYRRGACTPTQAEALAATLQQCLRDAAENAT
jgi:hypothetical protein